MASSADFDVVVVGASIAGCSAARLFARAGARVALVERRPDPAAYKVTCTHNVQPSAVGAIERLGLAPRLDDAGAVRVIPAFWTPYGGWMRFPPDSPSGYGITRRRLDPILRELAAATPGVELMLGRRATKVLHGDGRVAGVEVESSDHETRTLRAPLTVAADGRDSAIARLAGVRARVSPHGRFFYFAYWRGLRPWTERARVWFLDPDVAGALPSEEDLTVVVAAPVRARLGEFRAGPEAAYLRMIAQVPDGPELAGGERVSKLIGKLDVPNKFRPATRPGLAFVGDAAVAADPIFGVGCGWAFQTAEWLAERAAPALGERAALDAALARYRRTVLRRLGPHHLQMVSFATGRRMRLDERATFAVGAEDEAVAAALEEFATRRRSPARLLDPRLTPRLLGGLAKAAAGDRRAGVESGP